MLKTREYPVLSAFTSSTEADMDRYTRSKILDSPIRLNRLSWGQKEFATKEQRR